jgi:hypothetical protein
MSIPIWVARTFIVLQILIVVFLLLPEAGTEGTGSITIPDVIWLPLSAVLQLNRLLPINELLATAVIIFTVRMLTIPFWLGSWLLRHLSGGG